MDDESDFEQTTELPAYLEETHAMLENAFPKGIPEDDLAPLIIVLHEEMSLRNIAKALGYLTGRHYLDVMSTVLGVLTPPEFQSHDRVEVKNESVEEMRSLLNMHGRLELLKKEEELDKHYREKIKDIRPRGEK